MKVKIAGQISIVVSGFCFLIIFYGSCVDLLNNLDVFFNGYPKGHDYHPFFFPQAYKSMAIAFPFLMMVLYVVWTKFGEKRNEAKPVEFKGYWKIYSSDMKIRIAGIIGFVTMATITALLFYFVYKAIIFIVENDEVDPTYPIPFIFIGLLFIFPISSMLYIYWTKFGRRDDIELVQIEKETNYLESK